MFILHSKRAKSKWRIAEQWGCIRLTFESCRTDFRIDRSHLIPSNGVISGTEKVLSCHLTRWNAKWVTYTFNPGLWECNWERKKRESFGWHVLLQFMKVVTFKWREYSLLRSLALSLIFSLSLSFIHSFSLSLPLSLRIALLLDEYFSVLSKTRFMPCYWHSSSWGVTCTTNLRTVAEVA